MSGLILVVATMAAAALAQERDRAPDGVPKQRPAVQNRVNFRLHEWFDEEREDGITDAGHHAPLQLRHPGGQMSYNSFL